MKRFLLAALAFAISLPAAEPVKPPSLELRAIETRVRPEALRAHTAFLSSDLLEGRSTPSRGLDIAAEYIAAQLQRMGLEPLERRSYFQNAIGPLSRRAALPAAPARNVGAILRGSDARLRNTYVIVSAHYDHVGMAQTGGDRVFNGANDDASGVASVLEVAYALSSLRPRPKRSILFLLFYGEERGLLGSRYYAEHPLVPLSQTVAQLNLEQMGRTDSTEGPKIRSANLTGFDFSTLTQILVDAGTATGVSITKDREGSDPYFNRSDNASLARAGVPAHTMSVTYEFPDYHKVTDEWPKIDYENMAQVDRAVALAILRIANSLVPPQWNQSYGPAKAYAEAGKKLYGR